MSSLRARDQVCQTEMEKRKEEDHKEVIQCCELQCRIGEKWETGSGKKLNSGFTNGQHKCQIVEEVQGVE